MSSSSRFAEVDSRRGPAPGLAALTTAGNPSSTPSSGETARLGRQTGAPAPSSVDGSGTTDADSLPPPKPTGPVRRGRRTTTDDRRGAEVNGVNGRSVASVTPRSSRRDFYRVPQAAPLGGVGFTDRAELERQRHVVGHMLRQVGNNFMEGKDLVNLSLPIRLFEPRSFMQRLTEDWSYCTLFLRAAALATDPLERFKHTIAFAVAGLHKSAVMFKPFNPLLGETYQAVMPSDGTRIYLEQSCHHPPVTHWRVSCGAGLYEFTGFGAYSAKVHLFENSVRAQRLGVNVVTFQDGSRVVFWLPHMKIHGIAFGERRLEYLGRAVFIYEWGPLSGVTANTESADAHSLPRMASVERCGSGEMLVDADKTLIAVMHLNNERGGILGSLRDAAKGLGRIFGGSGRASYRASVLRRRSVSGMSDAHEGGGSEPTDLLRGVILRMNAAGALDMDASATTTDASNDDSDDASASAPANASAGVPHIDSSGSGLSTSLPTAATNGRRTSSSSSLLPDGAHRVARRQVQRVVSEFSFRRGIAAWESSAVAAASDRPASAAAPSRHTSNAAHRFSGAPERSRSGRPPAKHRPPVAVLSTFWGTYLGFLEFDGVRYWDIREMPGEQPVPVPETDVLPSDSRFRQDVLALRQALQYRGAEQEARMNYAQAVKERVENAQRADRALRQKGYREHRWPEPPPFVPDRILREDSSYWP
ncbi:hypothetical protein CDCA_CDCA04G1186 [Cyanidium caldarium]|uniref:Oxysterol-binding protein n=1 Tax=Cyanidium caldarium TaxID=2771 RepID=A0AAV9ISK9_CYACA|nr:hypothetical protein CDCA_CDCA04G1186 [Cyanidium caldarium]